MALGLRICIDRGGTFTDVYAERGWSEDKEVHVLKLLSVDPENYEDAPTEGIRRVMEHFLGEEVPSSKDVDTCHIDWIRMGTTVATNALLERKGARSVLLITKGFGDSLRIGNQSRPNIFALNIPTPEDVYERVIEVDERVHVLTEKLQEVSGVSEGKSPYEMYTDILEPLEQLEGTGGEVVNVVKRPDLEALRAQLQEAYDAGVRSCAVVLVHSYAFARHEQQCRQVAEEVGFENISISSEVMPMFRLVGRGQTTCVDAYLTPVLMEYLQGFRKGFKDNLKGVNVDFMQSDGGLTDAESFRGCRAIFSGPAGGVVGYAKSSFSQRTRQAVMGFDMGGTSTDVSRFDGAFRHVFEVETAGVMLQTPQLEVQTVAAGGGSRLFVKDGGMLAVGPESSGAHPGPVCYRKGGYLSVTDANVVLGRILPDYFPAIFGPNEDQPLDVEGSLHAMEEITEEVNKYCREQGQPEKSVHEVAAGFIRVANETMSRPIRSMTVAKGHDTREHALSCFGGAGGQHAVEIARGLGITSLYIHRYSGILSAFGMLLADVVDEQQEPTPCFYNEEALQEVLEPKLKELREKALQSLREKGFKEHEISAVEFLHLRYDGTESNVMVSRPEDGRSFAEAFEEQYRQEFGFTLPHRRICVDDCRVRSMGNMLQGSDGDLFAGETELFCEDGEPVHPDEGLADKQTEVYFSHSGMVTAPVYLLGKLVEFQQQHAKQQLQVAGPAVVMMDTSTVILDPGSQAKLTRNGNLFVKLHKRPHEEQEEENPSAEESSEAADPVMLAIFSHRFMGIAEQMGHTLERTSISTNIRERRDFSCAIFDPDGKLVANAPNLPVHLGSMSEAVKWQIQHLGDSWNEGDVILTNHPCAGGSHLPDLTVITPVYSEGRVVFYVASRGHHADIGGSSPGSMPPFSRSLSEEGLAVKSFKLVEKDVFQDEALHRLLEEAGSRTIRDNFSDLKAQIAANNKGISLVHSLIEHYGLQTVHSYMLHVQHSAEVSVRNMLRRLAQKHGQGDGRFLELSGEDMMDDGTPICITIRVDVESGDATADFSKSGMQVSGNTNTPRAVTVSALLYCLRCLVDDEIPLNEGCLAPVHIVFPDYPSIINPTQSAAVVGGNVLTSQRVTDTILGAFKACGASQGCMNNFTFGNEKFGYYETIAGGSGAGPDWHGCDAVQTHMTNTRITDVEVLERRYPVLLRSFGIRRGSGGSGRFHGGNGIVREFLFLEPLHFGILSERRAIAPYGCEGGGPGQRGLNLMQCSEKDGSSEKYWVNLGSKSALNAQAGDCVQINTPGGGGYGPCEH